MTPLLLLTTFPTREEAESAARALVEQKLAACASVEGPLRSIYRWRGAVESAEEWKLTLKTAEPKLPALEAALRAIHPYEIPELLALPVAGGSGDYLTWLAASLE